MFPLILVTIFCSFCQLSLANDQYFTSPPRYVVNLNFVDNLVYNVGDVLLVQWVTEQTDYSIWLWQQALSGQAALLGQTIYTKIPGGPQQSSFNWTISLQAFSLSQSNVFFLELGSSSVLQGNYMISHYFNLTDSAKPQTTIAPVIASVTPLSKSSSALASSSTFSALTSYSSSSTATIPSSSSTTSNLNGQTQRDTRENKTSLGLGIGLGLALAFCVIGGILFFCRYKKRRNAAQFHDHGLPGYTDSTPAPPHMSTLVPELPGPGHTPDKHVYPTQTVQSSYLVELPGTESRRNV